MHTHTPFPVSPPDAAWQCGNSLGLPKSLPVLPAGTMLPSAAPQALLSTLHLLASR